MREPHRSLCFPGFFVERSMKALAKKRVARRKKAMKFHEKLANLVTASPISQNKIGDAVGIDGGHMSRLANGQSTPTPGQIVAIADYFQVPVRWLLDERIGAIPREDMEFTLDPAMFPVVRRLLDEPAFRLALDRLSREEIEARLMAAPGTHPALTPPAPATIVVSEIRGKAKDGPSSPAQEPKGA